MVLIVCLVLLLGALGLAGYAWYSTRSENARLRAQSQKIEDDRKVEENRRKQAELDKQKADEAEAMTLARSAQEAFAADARKLTNVLESLLVQIPAVQAQLEQLRTGEPGRKVAIHPDLLASARFLFERDASTLPAREDAVRLLEDQRRYLQTLAGNAGTKFVPSDEMKRALDDSRTWVSTATDRLQKVKATADTLLREAEIKVAPAGVATPPPSLQAAIDALKQRERDAYIAKETVQVGAAREAATNELLAARGTQIATEAAIAAKKMEDENKAKLAQQQVETAKKEAEAKQKEIEARNVELRQKASTAEVQGKLAPFITPGYVQVKGRTIEKKPYSFSALKGFGALDPSVPGLRKLADLASAQKDDVRPRWKLQRGPVLFVGVASELEKVREVQQLLTELGPVLVEMKLLEP